MQEKIMPLTSGGSAGGGAAARFAAALGAPAAEEKGAGAWNSPQAGASKQEAAPLRGSCGFARQELGGLVCGNNPSVLWTLRANAPTPAPAEEMALTPFAVWLYNRLANLASWAHHALRGSPNGIQARANGSS